jgi:hypothetical protein
MYDCGHEAPPQEVMCIFFTQMFTLTIHYSYIGLMLRSFPPAAPSHAYQLMLGLLILPLAPTCFNNMGGAPRTIWTFNPDLQPGRSTRTGRLTRTRTFNPDMRMVFPRTFNPDVKPILPSSVLADTCWYSTVTPAHLFFSHIPFRVIVVRFLQRRVRARGGGPTHYRTKVSRTRVGPRAELDKKGNCTHRRKYWYCLSGRKYWYYQ